MTSFISVVASLQTLSTCSCHTWQTSTMCSLGMPRSHLAFTSISGQMHPAFKRGWHLFKEIRQFISILTRDKLFIRTAKIMLIWMLGFFCVLQYLDKLKSYFRENQSTHMAAWQILTSYHHLNSAQASSKIIKYTGIILNKFKELQYKFDTPNCLLVQVAHQTVYVWGKKQSDIQQFQNYAYILFCTYLFQCWMSDRSTKISLCGVDNIERLTELVIIN